MDRQTHNYASNGQARRKQLLRSPIEFTVFTKIGGPLTKRITLTTDGKIASDGSSCRMARGRAERAWINDLDELPALIEQLNPNHAIALGALHDDFPDEVGIVTKTAIKNGVGNGSVARTDHNLVYRLGKTALALFDYDTKGMPGLVAKNLAAKGGFWSTLVSVLPALASTGYLLRLSTSAGLTRTDTGAVFPGSGGLHGYVAIKDGTDAVRFLTTLHARCWLAGFGWMIVGVAGQLLERSIIDRMVGSPERLVFEGPPVVVPPLRQDAAARRPTVVAGDVLDTITACPPLTITERARLKELKAKERGRLAPEAAKVRDSFVAVEARELATRTGMTEQAARATVKRWCEGVLRPDVVLPFDDEALEGFTVGDVLADPERFEGETLADPLQSVAYGRCRAKIMRRANGEPWISSFAHGRTIYTLKHDAVSVRKAMEASIKGEVAVCFAMLAAKADLDPIELEELRQLAKTLSGTGLRAINAMLKSAQEQHAASNTQAARDFRASQRQDPRLRIRAPFPDEPWLPQIEVLNEVIGAVETLMPPSRDIDDDMMWVRKLAVPGTHAFTSSEANAETEENDE